MATTYTRAARAEFRRAANMLQLARLAKQNLQRAEALGHEGLAENARQALRVAVRAARGYVRTGRAVGGR